MCPTRIIWFQTLPYNPAYTPNGKTLLNDPGIRRSSHPVIVVYQEYTRTLIYSLLSMFSITGWGVHLTQVWVCELRGEHPLNWLRSQSLPLPRCGNPEACVALAVRMQRNLKENLKPRWSLGSGSMVYCLRTSIGLHSSKTVAYRIFSKSWVFAVSQRRIHPATLKMTIQGLGFRVLGGPPPPCNSGIIRI